MAQTAELYLQTGFNAIDIPDSVNILRNGNFTKKTRTNLNLIQLDYISYLSVDNLKDYEARRVDYVIITDDTEPVGQRDICYIVLDFQTIAVNTVKFTLLLDAYNTMGGFNADSGNLILAGSANRMSVSLADDNANFYTLDEPFRPAERSKVSFDNFDKPTEMAEIYYGLIETLSVPPQIIKSIIKPSPRNNIKYVDSSTRYGVLGVSCGEFIVKQESDTPAGQIESYTYGFMSSPASRTLKETIVGFTALDNTIKQYKLATRWWLTKLIDYDITVDNKQVSGNLIQDFRDNGKEYEMTALWKVPAMYIDVNKFQPVDVSTSKYNPEKAEDYGGLDYIENAVYNKVLKITPPTVYNNKAKYSQSYSIRVVSPVSGNQLEKKIYEIIESSATPANASFNAPAMIGADIRPNGCPFFLFKYINGEEQISHKTVETINGGAWLNIPLLAQGVSNVNYENARINQEANVAKFNAGISAFLAIVSGGIAVATGGATAGTAVAAVHNLATASAAANAVRSVKGYAQANYQQSEQQKLLDMQGQQASAQITTGNSSYFREINENWFTAIIARYSDNDMQAYDTFLTKYGYNVGNKTITNADFYSRPAFNYIRINDISIESVHNSITLINKVREQLQAGVRIWHKKPEVQDMFAGGNR